MGGYVICINGSCFGYDFDVFVNNVENIKIVGYYNRASGFYSQ